MKADFLLLRQVHPNFFADGQLSSQVFSRFLKIMESCPFTTKISFRQLSRLSIILKNKDCNQLAYGASVMWKSLKLV